MISKVLIGVNNALKEHFKYPIYNRSKEQGLKPPAFFIRLTSVPRSDELGVRSKARVGIDVAYISDDASDIELMDVAWEIGKALHGIKIGGERPQNPIDLRTEIINEQDLHVYASYDIFWTTTEEHQFVETLEIGQGIKEESDGDKEAGFTRT